MKKIFSIKILLTAVIAVLLMSGSAFAGETHMAKIETDVRDAIDKNKVETITYMLKGVKEAAIDLNKDGELTVKYDPKITDADTIIYALSLIGHTAELADEPIDITKDERNPSKAMR